MTISIQDLPRAYVLLALYNNALYRGKAFKHMPALNFMASMSGNGTQVKAEQLVNELQQKNQSFYFKEVNLGAGPRLLEVDLQSLYHAHPQVIHKIMGCPPCIVHRFW